MSLEGLEAARQQSTEVLLDVVENAKEKKATGKEQFSNVFPEIPYTYNQASTALNERGYHVQWAKDDLGEENKRLRLEKKELEEKLKVLAQEIKKSKEEKPQVIWLSTNREEETMYLSIPVCMSIGQKWKKKFGGLSSKVNLGNVAISNFIQAIDDKKIIVKM